MKYAQRILTMIQQLQHTWEHKNIRKIQRSPALLSVKSVVWTERTQFDRAVRRGPRLLIQCILVNNRYLISKMKEGTIHCLLPQTCVTHNTQVVHCTLKFYWWISKLYTLDGFLKIVFGLELLQHSSNFNMILI